MAMESRPMSFINARRRRLNSSRPMARSGAAVASARRRVPLAGAALMDGRGTRLRLLAARGREFHEQQLHADAYELDHFGEGDFVLLGIVTRIHTHVRDLGEVANDLARF